MSTMRVEEQRPAATPRRRPDLRARLAAIDPLVVLIALVSLVVYLLHGFDKPLARDLGVYTYGGQRFLAGAPPYVGIMNRAGPLAHVLPGIGIWLGRLVGMDDVHGARAFYMLISVACVCLVYLVVRDLTRLRTAAVVAAAAFLGFQSFLDAATNGPRDKTAMTMFMLLALLAVARRRWVMVGVFIALGTLTWQPMFFVSITTAAVAVLLAPERRLMAVARIALGGAATSAVVMVYYVLNGALHTFFLGFVLINARYTRQSNVLSNPRTILKTLHAGYGASLWLIGFGFVAILVLAVMSVLEAWRTREVTPATYVGLGAGTLVGLAWALIAFNRSPDLYEMLPFAAIGIGGAVAALLRRLDLRVAIAVTALLAVVGTTYATVFSITTNGHGLAGQRRNIEAVLDSGPQPATVLSIQSPQVLALTGRVNPTRYQMFSNGFWRYVNHTWPGGLQGFLAWIDRQAPTYIVVQTGFHAGWLKPWLNEHYARIGPGQQIQWWVNKAVPPAQREQIRQARAQARKG